MKVNYKQIINAKINAINGALGTDYHISYAPQYGGWDMYLLTEDYGHSSGTIGFEYRKSNSEMMAYLEGIQHMLYHMEVAKRDSAK